VKEKEDEKLVSTCLATTNTSNNSWLIDSGCRNHLTNDEKLFREYDKIISFKSENWK